MKFKNEILITIICTIVIMVGTYIHFTLPYVGAGGLIHLGTPLSVAAVLTFKTRIGTISSTLGMVLFDLLGGYAIWVGATIIARAGQGLILGKCAFDHQRNGRNTFYNSIGVLLGGIWMCLTYFIFEGLYFQNWDLSIASLSGYLLQVIFGIVLGIPLSIGLNNFLKKYNL